MGGFVIVKKFLSGSVNHESAELSVVKQVKNPPHLPLLAITWFKGKCRISR